MHLAFKPSLKNRAQYYLAPQKIKWGWKTSIW